MTKNIGNFDKLIRIFIGIVLLALSFYSKSVIMALFGLFSIFEAISGWCVFYQLIGRNTCPIKNKSENKIPFLQIFAVGVSILVGAIILNIFAAFFDLTSWYDLFTNFDKNINKITIDNFLFLFLIYPFILGYIAYLTNKFFNKN